MSGRLLTTAAGLACAVLVFIAVPRTAFADGGQSPSGSDNFGVQQGTSGVSADGSDVTVNAGLLQGTGGDANPGTTVSSSHGTTCTSQAVSGVAAANLMNQNPSTDLTINGFPGAGTWYLITCPGTTPSLVFDGAAGPGQAAAPLAQPRALAQQALATLHLPAPRVGMSPPSGAELVNFEDWLWVDRSNWQAISATAAVGPVAATARATPDRVVYDMGDGSEVTCRDPGTPYNLAVAPAAQSTDCSYRYATSSAGQPGNRYTATATIYWHVTWTSVGAPGGGDLGEIAGDSATVQVEVDEVQALNVAAR